MRRAAQLLLALGALAACAPAPAAEDALATLDNGLRLVIRPYSATDLVAVHLLLDVSILDEPPEAAGLRHLTQRLLLRGSETASGDEMAERLAAVGGLVDVGVGLDYVEVYAVAPADGFEVALELLAEAVQRPAFHPEEVERQRRAARQVVANAREDPFQAAYLALREGLYGQHPYGRSAHGAEPTLRAISRSDVVRFHAAHYSPDRATLAICGAVSPARVLRAVRRRFGQWDRRPRPERPPAPFEPLRASHATAVEIPGTQAHLMLGFPAPAADEPGYYALQVLDSLLSGGAAARLPRVLREEQGLVYHVSSFYPTLAGPSHLGIYAATEPPALEPVKAALLAELERLRREPVLAEELERAKRYLLGSYALSRQRLKEQAYALAWYEALGLGIGFEQEYPRRIEAVTAAQVQAAAGEVLTRFVAAAALPAH